MEKEFIIKIHITHHSENGNINLRISEMVNGKVIYAFICHLDTIIDTITDWYGNNTYMSNEVIKMAEIYKLKHNL